MLRSEDSSNNERGTSTTLLGKEMQMSLINSASEFSLSDEEIEEALTGRFCEMEDIAVTYFAGYVVKKVLSYHSSNCDICNSHGQKIMGAKELDDMEREEVFLWLKKYDEDCALYSPSEEMQDFVKSISLLVNFCYMKYLDKAKILKSITSLALKHAMHVKFCTPRMEEKAVSLTVRTIFLYKLKWANSLVKSGKKKNKRKLRILKHK